MDFRQRLFQYRSYTPIPFLLVMVFFAHPTVMSLIVGLATILGGESVRLWGVAIAGSETRTTGPVGGTFLITTGPFAYVRNPLYVGNMLIYFGVGIMSNALFPWLALGALAYFIMQYSFIVSLEEEYLRTTFGETYERYCVAVPRFLPGISGYSASGNREPELAWRRGLISERRTLQAIGLLTAVLLLIMWLRG